MFVTTAPTTITIVSAKNLAPWLNQLNETMNVFFSSAAQGTRFNELRSGDMMSMARVGLPAKTKPRRLATSSGAATRSQCSGGATSASHGYTRPAGPGGDLCTLNISSLNALGKGAVDADVLPRGFAPCRGSSGMRRRGQHKSHGRRGLGKGDEDIVRGCCPGNAAQ